jgi:hypothetical protein
MKVLQLVPIFSSIKNCLTNMHAQAAIHQWIFLKWLCAFKILFSYLVGIKMNILLIDAHIIGMRMRLWKPVSHARGVLSIGIHCFLLLIPAASLQVHSRMMVNEFNFLVATLFSIHIVRFFLFVHQLGTKILSRKFLIIVNATNETIPNGPHIYFSNVAFI